jgi:hypothetical protein
MAPLAHTIPVGFQLHGESREHHTVHTALQVILILDLFRMFELVRPSPRGFGWLLFVNLLLEYDLHTKDSTIEGFFHHGFSHAFFILHQLLQSTSTLDIIVLTSTSFLHLEIYSH